MTILRTPMSIGIALALCLQWTQALASTTQQTASIKHLATERVHSFLSTKLPKLDEQQQRELAASVVNESVRAGLDPILVLAIMRVESNFDHEAVSPTGARGLMQVVSITWREQTLYDETGPLEYFDPVHNVRVGVGYLRRLSTRFSRLESTLLAYNQGPTGAVNILKGRVDPSEEARNYVPLVVNHYRRLLRHFGFGFLHPRDCYKAPHLTLLSEPKPSSHL
jgi:soluble lytic murein transglycosylase